MAKQTDLTTRLYEQVDAAAARWLAAHGERWNRNLALYRARDGEAWLAGEGGELRRVQSNYLADGIEIGAASLTYSAPEWTVTTQGSGDELEELLLAEVLTRDFTDSGAWAAAKEAQLDRRLYGIGCVYLGWTPGQAGLPESADTPEQDQAEAEAALGPQALAEMMAGMGMVPPPAPEAVSESAPLVGEGARVLRVAPEDLLIDPRATWADWPWRARWVGRKLSLTPDELRSLPGLKLPKDLERAAERETRPGSQDRRDQNPEAALTLYEVWFRGLSMPGPNPAGHAPGPRNQRGIWCPSLGSEPLLWEPWPYTVTDRQGLPRYPFALLVGRKLPGALVGQSDAEIAESQQLELNLMRSAQATHAIVSIPKLQTAQQLSDEQLAALESPDYHGVIEGVTDLQAVPTMPPNPAVYKAADDAVRDMSAHTGVSEAARGIQAQQGGNITATEALSIQQQSSTRASNEEREWEEFLVAVAEVLWGLRKAMDKYGERDYWIPLPQDVAATTPVTEMEGMPPESEGPLLAKGTPVPLRLRQAQLRQELDIRLETGSTRLRDTQREVQGLTQMLQILAPTGLLATPATPGGFMDAEWLIRQLAAALQLKDLDKAFDTSKYVQMAQQQMAQQAQMQAMAGALAPPQGPQGTPGPPSGGGPGASGPPQLPIQGAM